MIVVELDMASMTRALEDWTRKTLVASPGKRHQVRRVEAETTGALTRFRIHIEEVNVPFDSGTSEIWPGGITNPRITYVQSAAMNPEGQ